MTKRENVSLAKSLSILIFLRQMSRQAWLDYRYTLLVEQNSLSGVIPTKVFIQCFGICKGQSNQRHKTHCCFNLVLFYLFIGADCLRL